MKFWLNLTMWFNNGVLFHFLLSQEQPLWAICPITSNWVNFARPFVHYATSSNAFIKLMGQLVWILIHCANPHPKFVKWAWSQKPSLAISKVLATWITLPNSFRFGQGIQSFVMTKAKWLIVTCNHNSTYHTKCNQ